MKKFELGEMLMTCGIADEERSDRGFAMFVNKSIERHGNCDWGDLCDEDKATNDDALEYGGRLMSQYRRESYPSQRIWIITEADRSCTTVLFPHEY